MKWGTPPCRHPHVVVSTGCPAWPCTPKLTLRWSFDARWRLTPKSGLGAVLSLSATLAPISMMRASRAFDQHGIGHVAELDLECAVDDSFAHVPPRQVGNSFIMRSVKRSTSLSASPRIAAPATPCWLFKGAC